MTKRAWAATAVVLSLSACVPVQHRAPATTEDLSAYARLARVRHTREEPSSGSLFSASSPSPYRDFRAGQVDDIVFIRVVETTEATASAETSSDRSATIQSQLPRLFGLERLNPLRDMVAGDSSGSFAGNGATRRSNEVTTSVAARVSDVLPNGNLVIEARRRVAVNGEVQQVALVGLVRPTDVDASGTVLSTLVADLEIIVDGRGVVTEAERPAWLYRILTNVLPL